MFETVKTLQVLEDHVLQVVFDDDLTGTVAFTETRFDKPIFAPLKDPAFFRQAYIDHGAVTWPNGADLAPDAMYAEIRQHGVWRLT